MKPFAVDDLVKADFGTLRKGHTVVLLRRITVVLRNGHRKDIAVGSEAVVNRVLGRGVQNRRSENYKEPD